MAFIAPDSDTAKLTKRLKRIQTLYNLARLDVIKNPLYDYVDVYAEKGDMTRTARINENYIDWRSVEHVVSTLFSTPETTLPHPFKCSKCDYIGSSRKDTNDHYNDEHYKE